MTSFYVPDDLEEMGDEAYNYYLDQTGQSFAQPVTPPVFAGSETAAEAFGGAGFGGFAEFPAPSRPQNFVTSFVEPAPQPEPRERDPGAFADWAAALEQQDIANPPSLNYRDYTPDQVEWQGLFSDLEIPGRVNAPTALTDAADPGFHEKAAQAIRQTRGKLNDFGAWSQYLDEELRAQGYQLDPESGMMIIPPGLTVEDAVEGARRIYDRYMEGNFAELQAGLDRVFAQNDLAASQSGREMAAWAPDMRIPFSTNPAALRYERENPGFFTGEHNAFGEQLPVLPAIQNAVGDVAEAYIRGFSRGRSPGAERFGRQLAEGFVPTRPGEIALEMIPGFGSIPGAATAAAKSRVAIGAGGRAFLRNLIESGAVEPGAVRRIISEGAVVSPGRIVSPTEGEGLARIAGGAEDRGLPSYISRTSGSNRFVPGQSDAASIRSREPSSVIRQVPEMDEGARYVAEGLALDADALGIRSRAEIEERIAVLRDQAKRKNFKGNRELGQLEAQLKARDAIETNGAIQAYNQMADDVATFPVPKNVREREFLNAYENILGNLHSADPNEDLFAPLSQYLKEIPAEDNVYRFAVREGAVAPAEEGLAASRGAVTVTDPSGIRRLGPREEPGPGETLMFHGSPAFKGTPESGMFFTPNPDDAATFARVSSRLPPSGGGPVPPAGAGGGGPLTPPSAATPPAGTPVPGSKFIADLRPIGDVQNEVTTSDNPVIRAIAGRTGINPSVLDNTYTGKALTAYMRQRIAVDELTDTALQAALDSHAQMFTGRSRYGIDNEGLMNVTRKGSGIKGKAPWQDVYSRPGDFNLNKRTTDFINDYRQVVDEIEALRQSHGLTPRSKQGPEGWGYVPRQVKSVRGVEVRRPSNAGLQRIYEDAVDGYGRGVRYDRDPRATLELHVRNAYREIAEKQLGDLLEPLSVRPNELIPIPVVKRLQDAIRNRRSAETAARQAFQAKSVGKGKAPMPSTYARNVYNDPAVVTARKEYQAAKAAYGKASQAALKAQVAPAGVFGGPAGETIPIAMWRNRFFPQQDAERIAEVMGRFTRKGEVNPANWGAKALGHAANYTRFLASVGDFATPVTIGLPTFGTNPGRWAQATLRHFQAFLDPAAQARFVKNHLGTFQEMSRYGVPIGDPEFFKVLREGEGLPLGKALGPARGIGQNVGKQTFGRFGSSYGTYLGASRAYLWEASKMAPTEKAQWIRNLTGGLDTRAIGVGPKQREVESLWMAFSPRLFRSTAALIGDAMRPNTPQGRAALRSLVGTAAATTGLYIASGYALGKSEEEIKRGLDPTQGKKFLSHEINGDWIGVGGQIRSIIQLIGTSFAAASDGNLDRFKQIDLQDNPLLAFYSTRGAPALNITLAGAEAVTQGRVNTLPYDTIDSLPDLAKHLGTAALPFAIQGVLEGQNVETSLASLFGARTSPQTTNEAIQAQAPAAIDEAIVNGAFPPEVAESLRDLGYFDLTPRERKAIEPYMNEEDLKKRTQELRDRGSIFQETRDAVDEYWQSQQGDLDELFKGLFKGNVDPDAVRKRVSDIKKGDDHFYEDPKYRKAVDALPDSDIQKLIDDWYSIPGRTATGGIVDWEKTAVVQREFLKRLAEEDRALANRLAFNVQDVPDPSAHKLIQFLDSAQPYVDSYYNTPEKQRIGWRAENPKGDYLLWLLGYVDSVRSEEAAKLAQKTTSRNVKLVK